MGKSKASRLRNLRMPVGSPVVGCAGDTGVPRSEENLQLLEKTQLLEKREQELSSLGQLLQSSVAQWYWVDGKDERHAFELAAGFELEQAYQKWGDGTISLQSGAYKYEIDFDQMTQKNQQTGKERPIERKCFTGNCCEDLTQSAKIALTARSQEAEAMRREAEKMRAEVKEAKAERDDAVQAQKTLQLDKQRMQQRLREVAEAAFEAKLQHVMEERDDEVTKLQDAYVILEAKLQDVMKERDDAVTECKANCTDKARLEAELQQSAIDARCKVKQIKELARKLSETEKELQTIKQVSREQLTFERTETQKARDLVDKQADQLAWNHDIALAVVEFWKAPCHPLAVKLIEEPSARLPEIETVLKRLSHQGQMFNGLPSKCSAFQHIHVASVQRVHNPSLWQKYVKCKEDLKKKHQSLGICVQPVRCTPADLGSMLGAAALDQNEMVLAHGCSKIAADAIMKEGFDVRHASSHGGSLYGEGIYFAGEPCKANQYADPSGSERHIIIARVYLGDPKHLEDQYQGRLPALRPDTSKGRFDSHVVDPSKSKRGQLHGEYVVFEGEQAYPEMLITYKI